MLNEIQLAEKRWRKELARRKKRLNYRGIYISKVKDSISIRPLFEMEQPAPSPGIISRAVNKIATFFRRKV